MGWPVTHSRSPLLHGFWLTEKSVDGAYVPLPVRPENIAKALRALPILGFRGCNLTIPHKQAALTVVDRVEPSARRIGAVNTSLSRLTAASKRETPMCSGFVRTCARPCPTGSRRPVLR